MQTTLRIDDEIYRAAKAQAAATGTTLTRFIEDALRRQLRLPAHAGLPGEIRQRDKLMEALLKRTAHFRVGNRPSREEMNQR